MKKWECTVCGYIHEGEEPPEKCPVCGAGKEKFIEHITSDTVLSEPKQETPSILEKITALILENHLHPISVHGPNGIVPVVVVFFLLALIFESSALFSAAYFNLIAVLLSMPVVLIAGYLTWQKKYNGVKTSLFRMKIAASSLATTILVGLVTWRTVQPDVLTFESSDRYLFIAWSLLLLATVGIAGHLGGKLVFASKK